MFSDWPAYILILSESECFPGLCHFTALFFIGPGGQNESVMSGSDGRKIMKDSLNEGNKLLAKEMSIMWVKPWCCSISGRSSLLLRVEINVVNTILKLPLEIAAIMLKHYFI